MLPHKYECVKDQELTGAAEYAHCRRFVFTHLVAAQLFPA